MILTYKYRLKGKRCARQLRRFAWAANQVWNFCVQTQRSVQRAHRDGLSPRRPSFYDLKKLASGASKDLCLHAQSIQNVCEQFTKSRDMHKKCPCFRRSGGARRSLGWVPFQEQSRQVTPSSGITCTSGRRRLHGHSTESSSAMFPVHSSRGRGWRNPSLMRAGLCPETPSATRPAGTGGSFQEVDEVSTFTTQTCSTTGMIPPERPRGIAGLGMREWWCSACGEIHDRDVNAARNILALGLSAQPPAEESRVAHGC